MATSYKYPDKVDDLTVLDPQAIYSYADYLKWTFDERVELIKGKLFNRSPAPRRVHQEIHSRLYIEIGIFLKNRPCKVYSAPFDVRFPNHPKDSDDQTFTVVQPDLCVVCDLSKLDDADCKGAPGLIVEILSDSTASKDLNEKFELYQEHGVKEYWVVFPSEALVEVYDLEENDRYSLRGRFTPKDTLSTKVVTGSEVDLIEIFKDL